MRLPCALFVLLLATPAAATTLTVDAALGGEMAMVGGLGYGNFLSSSLWEYGMLAPNELRLDSFTVYATAPVDGTYRLAVGIVDGDRWYGDAYTSAVLTTTGHHALSTTIPGGLMLDPSLHYLPYIVPSVGWTIDTSLVNAGPGFVGMAILFNERNLIDGDLPHDRDVAMTATFAKVPEPSTLALMAVGMLGLWRLASAWGSTAAGRQW